METAAVIHQYCLLTISGSPPSHVIGLYFPILGAKGGHVISVAQ